MRSRLSPPRIRMPCSAPLPVPTIMAVGVASPKAHGHATTSTATAATMAMIQGLLAITMPVKSLFDSARESSRTFYASVLRGEVSDANVRGYLRMTSQIEDIWTQVEQKVATLIAQGANSWDAYAQAGFALAFVPSSCKNCSQRMRRPTLL